MVVPEPVSSPYVPTCSTPVTGSPFTYSWRYIMPSRRTSAVSLLERAFTTDRPTP